MDYEFLLTYAMPVICPERSENAMGSIEVASPPKTVVLFYTLTFAFKKFGWVVFEI